VLSVVQDQLERAMVEDPNTLEELEVEMLRKRFSYFNMQKVGGQLGIFHILFVTLTDLEA
jgi:hypothetical protein